MKKQILTFALLGLGLLSIQPLSAQVKVLSNGHVKMGCLSSSTSTTYGLEIGYPKVRLRLAASPVNITGVNPDITIYHECKSTGPIELMNASANAIMNCKVIVEGNIQLGTSKTSAKIIGTVTSPSSSGISVVSDRRYKDNIRNMESGLAQILQLQPVRFDYRQLNPGESYWDSLARFNKVGFIAQDVQEIIPEAVNYDPFDDLYALNQTDFIPYLVAGFKEMNVIIQDLTARIESLEAENAALSTPAFNSVKPKGSPAETVEATANRLWSNVPNPFKQETRIRYALTEDVREARLCIYDLSGKQLACHRLMDRGESEFTLRAESLLPGIYLYSLIADGNVIDTHRMVVTE